MARIGVIISTELQVSSRQRHDPPQEPFAFDVSQIRHRQNSMEAVVRVFTLVKDIYLYSSERSVFDSRLPPNATMLKNS